MIKALRQKTLVKITTFYMLVALSLGSFPFDVFADTPTITLLANGQSSLTLSGPTESFTITLSTANPADICTQTSPINSGISSSSSENIDPSHPFYPPAGGSTTFSVTCDDGAGLTASASVTVSLPPAPAPLPTVDLTVNGSNGPVTLNSGDTYTYSWNSTNSTSCEQTSPATSGIALSGSSATIDSSNPFYPSTTTPVTLTMTCTDGTNTASDSVTVNLSSGGGSTPTSPTIDLTVNGSNGPVVLSTGNTYTYSWNSSNATSCRETSPLFSGTSLFGTSAVIDSSHPFYPSVGSPVTITIECTDGAVTVSDSVVVSLSSGGGNPNPTTPTVDIKANGSDGPVTLNSGDTYTYSWTSANATSCLQTAPINAGVSATGTSAVIDSNNTDLYPLVNAPVTLTITCTDGTNTASDSVTVNLSSGGGNPSTPPGDDDDNGGGGGGGRRRSTPPATDTRSCLWLRDYMRIDFQNDQIEVMKLQTFLKDMMGYSGVTVTGTFDQGTFDAVSAFQMQYEADILTPWGHTAPTGYVYILTLKKVNEIFCQRAFPITDSQELEIIAFRALLQSLRDRGFEVGNTPDGTVLTPPEGATTTPPEIPTVGQGQNLRNLASAIFTLPTDLGDFMQCLYEWLLIVIVLYILGSVLKDVLYKDLPENSRKRFFVKWITILAGLVISIVLALIFGELCIIFPLALSFLVALMWILTSKNHDSIRVSVKSWYIVLMARSKSFFNKANRPKEIEAPKIPKN
ncbi:MAG: T1SS secreted agglutinin RTX [Parcubacteria bacterium C7867-005]|nr:MAG: T1SS secreted agglutinin RTX [Parcubacteria bacterium C7867-005]